MTTTITEESNTKNLNNKSSNNNNIGWINLTEEKPTTLRKEQERHQEKQLEK